jgi:hypothetical protein
MGMKKTISEDYDDFCDETTQKMGEYCPGDGNSVPTIEQPDTVVEFDMPVPRMKNLCKCDSPKIERRRF